MNPRTFIEALALIVALGIIGVLTVALRVEQDRGQVVAIPKPVIAGGQGLARAPKLDDFQQGDVFDIRCTAYTNRPIKDFDKPYFGTEMIGARVVSDCVTLAKPKAGPVG